MNWTQPNKLMKLIYPGALWKVKTNEKVLFLTFDDGPIPMVTDWVLNYLSQYEIKATFFCIGNNIDNNPTIFQRIIKEGHSVGNHSYNHENGWKTGYSEYKSSIHKTAKFVHSNLFRPPYGKLSFRQFYALKKQFKIVLWDVLTYDYDKTISFTDSLKLTIEKTRPGSIIVFHDSVKAFDKMKEMLPIYIDDCLKKGFKFSTL